jgi:hypothetical protein
MEKIDIDAVYNRMIQKLKASGYSGEIQGIEKSSAGAATGSEALMDQGSYLINLQHSSPSAFKLIQSEINDYLNYCKQNGLLIRR